MYVDGSTNFSMGTPVHSHKTEIRFARNSAFIVCVCGFCLFLFFCFHVVLGHTRIRKEAY